MKMMNRILEETTLLNSFLDEDKLKEYKEILSNLKVEKLYHSKIHGEYHSEKVSLFAFILANEYHLDEVDKQIIMDAALYHDIGRMNDLNESFHYYYWDNIKLDRDKVFSELDKSFISSE